MASFYSSLIFIAFLICATNAQNGLILPIRKDSKTSQFYTTLQMGSNQATINTVIDLGAQFLWFSCNNYASNTYAPIPCGSTKCEVARGIGCVSCNLTPRPGCTNDTCSAPAYNPFQDVLVAEGFGEDTLYSKDHISVPQFIFSCMDNDYMQGLAKSATGLLGLSRTEISLHKQVANKLNLPDKFSLCLPSSGLGKLSFGSGLSPKSDISNLLKSTPLIINPVSTAPAYSEGDPSNEYFIDVKSIRVDGNALSVKDSYFSIDNNGVGGTKISTIQNYTALHNSIYKPFTRAFTKAASNMKIKSVAAVAPFRACFSSDSISRTPSGPSVPAIDLVLPGNDIYWRINGTNSMVEIDNKTTCLGFVDGGSNPRISIVIGAHQLEENYLEFDLVSSRLKFSSSLLVQNKSLEALDRSDILLLAFPNLGKNLLEHMGDPSEQSGTFVDDDATTSHHHDAGVLTQAEDPRYSDSGSGGKMQLTETYCSLFCGYFVLLWILVKLGGPNEESGINGYASEYILFTFHYEKDMLFVEGDILL
ncbi:hypothetical protein BUALT_Bualt14G0087600 [Buddleja alternifolia]|uniref:Peptidase A1 domain-containing protein n=1 Tax=Buddleja alternifolia TaxID=168488 RepID=A0AAV6WP02_9LAMI|nr:hypothetical protein BUALT_Bualt14G0087600 [Buddleja alternifolia]